jgi:phospholipid transport system transporter-binding protein
VEPGAAIAASVTVYLKGVTKADSSALALLIDWVAQARRAGGSVTFTNIPEQLVAIARLSDVDELFGIAPDTATEGAF